MIKLSAKKSDRQLPTDQFNCFTLKLIKVTKGESKNSYLRFDNNLRAGDDMRNTVEEAEGGETILHETQHLRIDQQTSITDKAMNNPFYQNRECMKPITSDWN